MAGLRTAPPGLTAAPSPSALAETAGTAESASFYSTPTFLGVACAVFAAVWVSVVVCLLARRRGKLRRRRGHTRELLLRAVASAASAKVGTECWPLVRISGPWKVAVLRTRADRRGRAVPTPRPPTFSRRRIRNRLLLTGSREVRTWVMSTTAARQTECSRPPPPLPPPPRPRPRPTSPPARGGRFQVSKAGAGDETPAANQHDERRSSGSVGVGRAVMEAAQQLGLCARSRDPRRIRARTRSPGCYCPLCSSGARRSWTNVSTGQSLACT